MLSSSNGLARIQNTEIQIDGVLCSRCLSTYYRQDKGSFTTTIQSITNEKKNNIIILPFSRVGISCCLICKHKNTGLVTVPCNGTSKTTRDTFFVAWISCPDGRLFCKHHLFNCLNLHIFKHYNL